MGSVNEEFWFKESLIFVVIFSLIRIWWARQFVRWGIDLARDVLDGKVIFLEVGMPSCCSMIEFLWGLPIL